MDTDVQTIPEVTKLLRIGEKTAYTLAREGKLPAVRVGNQWLVNRVKLMAWLEAGRDAGLQRVGREDK